MSRILLVEPNFPYPPKSKNQANGTHKNFIPIGLLKIGSYYKEKGHEVKLVRGNKSKKRLKHTYKKIMITTLFTYWSKYVWDCVKHYRKEFPNSEILLGGIYASLHHDKKYFIKLLKKYNAKVKIGLHNEAEKYIPDYTLVGPVDYHAMHGMRGCIRRCKFCGTWKVEPKKVDKTAEQIKEEILMAKKNKVIFYDNNFLANEDIEEILKMLAKLKVNNKQVTYESQSGFDGRILENKPGLVLLLKKAHFQNIRIAWDNGVSDKLKIKKQIDHLKKAGYNPRDISVFMIYNYIIPLSEMIKKVKYCFKWNVQIADCRYRPLDCIKDDYNPNKWEQGQTSEDYFIHKNWSDRDVRIFRKIVRIHNIVIRYVLSKINRKMVWDKMERIKNPLTLLDFYENKIGYKRNMERWSGINTIYKFFGAGNLPTYKRIKSSKILSKRIKLMKRVYHYCKKNNLRVSLNGIPVKRQEKKLLNFIKKNEITPL